MITLDTLISAVQLAVTSASETVAKSNFDLIEKYFDEITDGDELRGIIKSSIVSAEAAIAEGADDEAQENLREAARALEAAASKVGSGDSDAPSEPFYVPKRVAIQYPYIGPKGKPQVKNVYVPLITLVPMGVPEVQEVRFRANLEISAAENGQINVSFKPIDGQDKNVKDDPAPVQRELPLNPSHSATIDIVVSGPRTADGLLKVVEGYEKALRAQIPG